MKKPCRFLIWHVCSAKAAWRYLQILAVKSANYLEWKQAALSVLILFAGVLLLCGKIAYLIAPG